MIKESGSFTSRVVGEFHQKQYIKDKTTTVYLKKTLVLIKF